MMKPIPAFTALALLSARRSSSISTTSFTVPHAPHPRKLSMRVARIHSTLQTPSPSTPLEYPLLLHTVVVRDANAALKWYERALDATTASRYNDSDGRVLHAVLKTSYGLMIGVEDHYPNVHMVRPVGDVRGKGDEDASAKGCTYCYVTIPNGAGTADEAIERMRAAGATVVMEAEDRFYGQRMGQVVDPYGVAWAFANKIEPNAKEKQQAPPPGKAE